MTKRMVKIMMALLQCSRQQYKIRLDGKKLAAQKLTCLAISVVLF